ncbi:MAG TPA: SIR2 family protein, partial [Pyrinomonadaceae bacterium]|nr:SIR2 family protein [Pyrinomonadaceae bacterium]
MSHYENVKTAMQTGRLIPFLGAGVNLFGRKPEERFSPNKCLPSGAELADYLATAFTYNSPDRTNLLRVSQYAATMLGPGPLYNTLGEVFDADYPINDLHRFLAKLPSIVNETQQQRYPHQLIVTTNYDDVLEQALREESQPFDVVTYGATDPAFGKFRHVPHGALPRKGAALIRCGELKDKTNLALRLKDGTDECSAALRTKLSPDVIRMLESFVKSDPVSDELCSSLVNDLNRLLETPLYQEPAFKTVTLAGDALKLRNELEASPSQEPSDVVRLNRSLLEETFRQEITRSLRSYITIEDPNRYHDLPFNVLKLKRTVILKLHGTVDRVADRNTLDPDLALLADSFVITEDDYINYLSHTDISGLVPAQLKSKLMNSGFLFLGYGLRDWNLRVIMHRLWGAQSLKYASWAIQKEAEDLDKELWSKRSVRIIELPLE